MGTSSFKSAPLFCRNENGQAIKAQVIDMGGSSQVHSVLKSMHVLLCSSVFGGTFLLIVSLMSYLNKLLFLVLLPMIYGYLHV